jgi:hypothetical protein
MAHRLSLSEADRKEIFSALVAAQDRNLTVPESRKRVCRQYGISDVQVRQIERQGLDQSWPPLS